MTDAWLGPDALVVPVDYATYCAAEVARDAALFVVDHRDQFLANRDAGQFDGYPDPMAMMGEALASGAPADPPGACVATHLGTGPRRRGVRERDPLGGGRDGAGHGPAALSGARRMSGPGPEKRSRDELQAWMAWQPTRGRGLLDTMALTPARIVVGIGAALTVVATLLPWAAGRAPDVAGFEDVVFLGTQGAGDGVVLLIVAAIAGFLTLHRAPAGSRVRVLRAMPAVLVLLAVSSWITGWRDASDEVDAWIRRGGSGGISVGVWLAGIGIALMALGTIALLPQVIRWKTQAGDPTDMLRSRPPASRARSGGSPGSSSAARSASASRSG